MNENKNIQAIRSRSPLQRRRRGGGGVGCRPEGILFREIFSPSKMWPSKQQNLGTPFARDKCITSGANQKLHSATHRRTCVVAPCALPRWFRSHSSLRFLHCGGTSVCFSSSCTQVSLSNTTSMCPPSRQHMMQPSSPSSTHPASRRTMPTSYRPSMTRCANSSLPSECSSFGFLGFLDLLGP